jgi:uncharacterized membrane protein
LKAEHRVVIDRPLEEVWAVFDDPDAMVEWQGNLVSYEEVSDGVSLQTVRNAGMNQELTVTLLEHEPPMLAKSRYEGAQVPFEVTNTFTAVDDDSTEWVAVMDLKLNLLTKALGPVLKPVMTELIKRNGRDFKQYAEAQPS